MLRNKPYAAARHYNETHMSSSPHLRALWGAALCCALPLATRAADAPCIEPWQRARALLPAPTPVTPGPAAPPAATPGNGFPFGAGHRGPGVDITYRADQ